MLFTKGDVNKGLEKGEWGERATDGMPVIACFECGDFAIVDLKTYTMTKTGKLKRPKELVCRGCGRIFEVELGGYGKK